MASDVPLDTETSGVLWVFCKKNKRVVLVWAYRMMDQISKKHLTEEFP